MKAKHIRHLFVSIAVGVVCAGFAALLVGLDETFPFRGIIVLSAIAGVAGFVISIVSPVAPVYPKN